MSDYTDAFTKGPQRVYRKCQKIRKILSIYERLIAIPLSVQDGLRINCVDSKRMTKWTPWSRGLFLTTRGSRLSRIIFKYFLNAINTKIKIKIKIKIRSRSEIRSRSRRITSEKGKERINKLREIFCHEVDPKFKILMMPKKLMIKII